MSDFRWHAGRVLAVALTLPVTVAAQSPAAADRWYAAAAHPEDFEFIRDTTVSHGGRASIRVRGEIDADGFASATIAIPVQPYIGHRIRFSAYLRTASLAGGGGALWARADDANHRSVAFINTQTTPVRGTTDWTQITLSLDIPAAASQLLVGALCLGSGVLWVDDVRLEVDGGTPPRDFGFEDAADVSFPRPTPRLPIAHEAPRALSTLGLANVTAFTRALGYVRFFHPSAAAVNVNWDAFAVRGIRAVENAPTPDSLAATLQALFAPVAPTVVFARTGAPLRTSVAPPAGATHAVFWLHQGVGMPSGGVAPVGPMQNIYRSERVVVTLDAVGRPLDIASLRPGTTLVSQPIVPDPSRPLAITLEGGVTASVPVALFTTETVVPEGLRAPKASPVAERFSANDRATRLADVALAWSLFEHFYPYFDVVKTDWPAARAAALRSAAIDPDAEAFQRTLERLIAALHDGHGGVYRGVSATSMPDIRLGWAEGRVFVTGVGDSSTGRGVRIGDELLAANGRRIDSLLTERSELASGATPQWIRSRALSTLLAVPIGTPMTLRLRGSGGAIRDVRLALVSAAPVTEPAVAKIADVAPGVMYVDIDRITDADFSAALPRLERARAIIFDMRGYPRQVNTPMILAHLSDSVIHSAHFQTPMITMPNYRNVGYLDGAWTVPPASPRLKGRVVFLTSGGAISYAESTLGVVEAYHLADIVGEPSAGTNGNVNPFSLPGGYSVSWTGMLVQKRDGTPHHGVGVIPTVPVSPTAAGLRAGRDEILERAVALVALPVVP